MLLRRALLLLGVLIIQLMATSAGAAPNFLIRPGAGAPSNFISRFNDCIAEFRLVSGPSTQILSQLNGANVIIHYVGGDTSVTPPPGTGDTTGLPVTIHWASNTNGTYDDGATRDRCATLLHELNHAARYFKGRECNGPHDANGEAFLHDEALGVRAENWWLYHLGRPATEQRRSYDGNPLGRWTRWPELPGQTIPPAPRCLRACESFHQDHCADFRGGIYSGGDHRRVASGSLKIEIGDLGYCQDRLVCEFKHCVTCPHLDTAFPIGATVTAIATPDPESRFARWGPGACRGQGPTCTFVARKDSCISAQFLLTNPTAPPQSLPNVPCP